MIHSGFQRSALTFSFLAPNEAESEELSRSAALLYGLIHARYIITSIGLETMVLSHPRSTINNPSIVPKIYHAEIRGVSTDALPRTGCPSGIAIRNTPNLIHLTYRWDSPTSRSREWYTYSVQNVRTCIAALPRKDVCEMKFLFPVLKSKFRHRWRILRSNVSRFVLYDLRKSSSRTRN